MEKNYSNTIKKLLYFIVPMFITLMYLKLGVQVCEKKDFSNDAIIVFTLINIIIFLVSTIVFISDIVNLFKGKKLALEIALEEEDDDDDDDDNELDIEIFLKGYKWYYTFSYDYKGNEKAIYIVEDFKPTTETLKIIKKNYIIEQQNNLTILTYIYGN